VKIRLALLVPVLVTACGGAPEDPPPFASQYLDHGFVELRAARDGIYRELVGSGDEEFEKKWEADDYVLASVRPDEDFPNDLWDHRPGVPFLASDWDDEEGERHRVVRLPIAEHRELYELFDEWLWLRERVLEHADYPGPSPFDRSDLTGTYSRGDGFTTLTVTLLIDGRCTWGTSGCSGVYETGTGRWLLRGDEVVFTPGVDDVGRVIRAATVVDFEGEPLLVTDDLRGFYALFGAGPFWCLHTDVVRDRLWNYSDEY
jgi:hypothetical protein